MKTNPNPSTEIMTRLLMQAAQGNEDVPGLYLALEQRTPIPTALPGRHLSRDEFLSGVVTPWLAARLRGGAAYDDVVREYRMYARPTAAIGTRCKNILLERGVMAVEFGALRDLLQHDDDALLAVMCVSSRAGVNGLSYVAGHHTTDPRLLRSVITDVRQVAAYLATMGPTLRPNWPRVGQIALAPVIAHLHQVAQTLSGTQATDIPTI